MSRIWPKKAGLLLALVAALSGALIFYTRIHKAIGTASLSGRRAICGYSH